MTTQPNGAAKKQKGFHTFDEAIENVEWLSVTEHLNETELIIRHGEGVETTLRVV